MKKISKIKKLRYWDSDMNLQHAVSETFTFTLDTFGAKQCMVTIKYLFY